MVVCPICETRFSDSEVSFCSNCAWDLKNDPMIAISLDRMPKNVMAEWQQRREVAKKVWNERKRLEALEAEKNFWDSRQKQGTIKAYQDYEQKYPNGEFIQHAKKQRHEIEQSQNKQRKGKEEKEYWNRQSKMSGKAGFENYLKKYPQGSYAAEARKAVQEFDKQQVKIRKKQEENRKAERSQQKKLKKKAGFKFTKANLKLFLILFLVIVGVFVVGFVIQFGITHQDAIMKVIMVIILGIILVIFYLTLPVIFFFLGWLCVGKKK